MSTFPTNLPALQRVSSLDKMNDPGREADLLYNRVCDEVEALAATVGATGTVVAGTVEKRLVDLIASLTVAAHRLFHEGIESWEDLQCPADGFNPPGGATSPTKDDTTVPGTWLFSGTTEQQMSIVKQFPHSWKAGSSIHPHIHWEKTTTDVGEVRWEWAYSIANVGDVFPAYSAWIPATNSVSHSNTVRKHALDAFPELAMAGKKESCMICITLRRLPTDAADTYTADARFLGFDIHYLTNKDGTEIEFPS